jgi:hypothetical protein
MPEAEEKKDVPAPRARWVHTLSGSWSTQTYGIVEYLRVHSVVRWAVGFLGVASCIIAVLSFAGLKIPGLTFGFIPFFLAGPWLIYVSTISGAHFEVTFPQKEAEEQRVKAEQKFEESKTVEDALRLDLTKLNQYYVINQSQARSSFGWAVFSMLLGFGTIISGIWLFYLRGGQGDTFMASLTTAAGCVVNFVSALFLYLHAKTQSRSLHYYEQLSRLQHLSIAIRLAEAQENSHAKEQALNLIIRQLVGEGSIATRSPVLNAGSTIESGTVSPLLPQKSDSSS